MVGAMTQLTILRVSGSVDPLLDQPTHQCAICCESRMQGSPHRRLHASSCADRAAATAPSHKSAHHMVKSLPHATLVHPARSICVGFDMISAMATDEQVFKTCTTGREPP